MSSGMDDRRLYYYLMEIEWQCETALSAFGALPEPDPTRLGGIDADDVYRAVQAGMAAAANVSKMLCSKKKAARADHLRAVFGVGDDSPIASRTLRNHFEHFDERLDRWIDEHAEKRSIVNRNVQPMNEGIRAGVESGRVLHHYDPITRVAYFRGDKFPVDPVLDELRLILGVCHAHCSSS